MGIIERELTEEEERINTRAVLAHVLPFVMWLTMMVWLDDPAWNYNARTLGGLLLLVFFRPWRWYPKFQLRNLPIALESGLAFFLFGLDLKVHGWCIFATNEWYDRLFVDLTQPFKVRELLIGGDGTCVPFMVIEEGIHCWTTCV